MKKSFSELELSSSPPPPPPSSRYRAATPGLPWCMASAPAPLEPLTKLPVASQGLALSLARKANANSPCSAAWAAQGRGKARTHAGTRWKVGSARGDLGPLSSSEQVGETGLCVGPRAPLAVETVAVAPFFFNSRVWKCLEYFPGLLLLDNVAPC